jgi:hypothetical protein
MTEPFSELVVERAGFGRLELQFTGDLFELEDQRNWGDASFKTYCTPLRSGFPRTVKAGTTISQSVEVRFVPAAEAGAAPTHRDAEQRRVFPAIGREWQPASSSNDERAWHHVLLRLSKPEDVATLRAALESRPRLLFPSRPAIEGLLKESPRRIELQVDVESAAEWPPDWVSLLSQLRDHILRLLLCGRGTSLPSAQAVNHLRTTLASSGGLSFPLLAATRGYFVELNRATQFDTPVTGIAFPLTATVHAVDPETITENVPAIVDMTETARHLTRTSEVVILPLALNYPRAPTRSSFPRPLVKPWLAATLMHAALAGATSVTLAADLLEALASDNGQFISGLLECSGLDVARVSLPLPAGLHALIFESKRMLIANLSSGTSLIVNGREVEIPQFGTRWIDLAP